MPRASFGLLSWEAYAFIGLMFSPSDNQTMAGRPIRRARLAALREQQQRQARDQAPTWATEKDDAPSDNRGYQTPEPAVNTIGIETQTTEPPPTLTACPCEDCEKWRYLRHRNLTAQDLRADYHSAKGLAIPDCNGSVPYHIARSAMDEDFRATHPEIEAARYQLRPGAFFA